MGVKFDNDGSQSSSSHAPSSGMISARRRANLEIAKKIQQDVHKSQEEKLRISEDNKRMLEEAERIKRSIEEKKSLLSSLDPKKSGGSSGG